jgi:hypothetical protein
MSSQETKGSRTEDLPDKAADQTTPGEEQSRAENDPGREGGGGENTEQGVIDPWPDPIQR